MKKAILIVLIIIGLISLSLGIYLSTKFKNAEIELGTKVDDKILIAYGSNNGVDTNLSNVNKDVVGSYPVTLKYLFMTYNLTIDVVDKTPPVLEVKDINKAPNYEIDVNDFIVNVSDKSKYEVSYYGDINTKEYGEYNVNILAKDIYDNKEEKKAKLTISWVKDEFSVEVGNIITIQDLVYDIKDKDTIVQKDLDEINKKNEGVYYIDSIKDGVTSKIKITKEKDITPPDLVLKNVTIYVGKKINGINDFIVKATDKKSKVTLNMLTTINYNKLGEQKISIEASDEDGNKITKETTLNIIKDTVGPKISGLSKLVVNKGTTIDYQKGVSSYDDNTGKCDFTVDSSSIDVTRYGTYYAIYTSTDALGNKTTSKRVIVINHDANDTNEKIKKIADTLPTDAEKIRDYVRNNISYNTNWGGDDPIWYGLTNKAGNCLVHATIFEALLKEKGYTTKLIWTTDKTHYWNMVYLNNKWVHMDSTPTSRHNKYSIMNDEQRYERLQGRNWDRSLWPKAE